MASATTPAVWRGLTRNVLLLGLVSLLTDVSSEMALTFLPFFLANVLGAKTAVVGLIEGLADSTASLTRLASGWLSDRWQARKGLVILGYGLSSLSKPFLYFASAWTWVLGVRFVDRVGKGIRSSPRDALLAASAPQETRGLSFGVHRAADTAGAFLGLSGVALIIYLTEGAAPWLGELAFRRMVLVAVLPALAAVAVLVWVREPAPAPRARGALTTARSRLGRRFHLFLAAAGLFSLANSSDAFLLLRTQDLGLSVFWIAVLMAGFNLTYSLLAALAGGWSDRVGRPRVIRLGWSVYALTYLGFALARSAWQVWPLFGLYALYYGLAEGAARAFVADLVSDDQRGLAYGLYNTVVGVTVFPASVLAGVVWQGIGPWEGWGPAAPFWLGAALSGAAVILFAATARGRTGEAAQCGPARG